MRPVTPALNFRALAVPVFIAVIAVACVQQRPPARTAEQECYRRLSQQRSIYTPRDFVLAVIKVKEAQRDIANRAALKTIGERAAARFPAETELAKAEDELTREKAEAEAVNRKLDEIEARVEAVKAQMSGCFGIGFSGKQAANRYAEAKKVITKHRKFATRRLDRVRKRHRDAAERAAFVERWRADNALHLKRKAGNADLEIVEVARLESYGVRPRVTPRVTVAVTNATSSTILRPRNWPVWGHGGGIELGRSVPISISTTDSFDNFYKVARVKQRWATSRWGLRPGETVFFELEYAEMPLEDTRFIRIILAYEQDQSVLFDIPAKVFFGGMAGRSQHRQ